jgi:multidrug efflux pump subunit AcrA (membrane-fusion protein)
MYVSVSFQLPAKGQVEVPAAALIFRPGGPEVARVGSDGKVRFVKVTIARDDGSYLELGPGVDPGDRLVLNISSQIGPGEVVAVGNSSLASAGNGAAAH